MVLYIYICGINDDVRDDASSVYQNYVRQGLGKSNL